MTEGKAARKGFITIATGRDEYFVLAHNLLLSYRFFSRSRTPFAIICDRENEYTADFDTVVLMDNPQRSVYDKLRLPELAPFDETIFIEADCLAYRDLNDMWEIFEDGPDFGALGTVQPLDSNQGWIRAEFLGEYRERVKYQYLHQGGVYYMRKGRLDAFIRTCQDIYLHREDFNFKLPNEEPIFALACLLHGFPPVKDWCDIFCFYPVVTVTRMDIRRGILSFSTSYLPQSAPGLFLTHWGSEHTREALYKREMDTVTALAGQGRHASMLIPVRIRLQIAYFRFKDRFKHLVPLKIKGLAWRIFHKTQKVTVSEQI